MNVDQTSPHSVTEHSVDPDVYSVPNYPTSPHPPVEARSGSISDVDVDVDVECRYRSLLQLQQLQLQQREGVPR